MLELLKNYDLMPFHLSVLLLLILGIVQSCFYYFRVQFKSVWGDQFLAYFLNNPLLNIKFSKILFLVFLFMNFSAAGYVLQFAIYSQQQHFIRAYYLIIPALIIALFFTIFMIQCLDQVIQPKKHKNSAQVLGRLATISQGNARPGFATQARVRDEFGQLHYVQVEPEFGELEFQSCVIIIREKKSHYIAKKISPANNLFYKN